MTPEAFSTRLSHIALYPYPDHLPDAGPDPRAGWQQEDPFRARVRCRFTELLPRFKAAVDAAGAMMRARHQHEYLFPYICDTLDNPTAAPRITFHLRWPHYYPCIILGTTIDEPHIVADFLWPSPGRPTAMDARIDLDSSLDDLFDQLTDLISGACEG